MIAALLSIAAALAALAFFSLLRIASLVDEDDVPEEVLILAHYEQLLRQRKGMNQRDPDREDLPKPDAAFLLANLPAWGNALVVVAIGVLLACSFHLDDLPAARATAAASRDIERGMP